jgi:hypothetical protein
MIYVKCLWRFAIGQIAFISGNNLSGDEQSGPGYSKEILSL